MVFGTAIYLPMYKNMSLHTSVKFLFIIGFIAIIVSALISIKLAPFKENSTKRKSDLELKSNFDKNKDDFNLLINMSKTDSKVIRIANDFTWLDNNTNWPRANSELGFSEDRWNVYRTLFHKLDLNKGLISYPDKNLIFLFNSIENDTAKGYAFSSTPLSPLYESLDDFPNGYPDTYKERNPIYVKLDENWYIFLKAY